MKRCRSWFRRQRSYDYRHAAAKCLYCRFHCFSGFEGMRRRISSNPDEIIMPSMSINISCLRRSALPAGWPVLLLCLLLALTTTGVAQRRVDDPDDQEDLNRELWEFARHSSYDSILPYIAAAQKQSKANEIAEIELPNGWRIAPAGTQIEVGRLPY